MSRRGYTHERNRKGSAMQMDDSPENEIDRRPRRGQVRMKKEDKCTARHSQKDRSESE